MRLSLLAAVFVAAIHAQTTVNEDQIKGPATTVTVFRVDTLTGYAWVQPDGKTFVIDTTATPPIARCIVQAGGGGTGPQGPVGPQGPQGPPGSGGGGAAINFADAETPAGQINGSNRIFTLAHQPIGGSLQLYRGIIQRSGVDYDLTPGGVINFRVVSTPKSTDSLVAWYRY